MWQSIRALAYLLALEKAWKDFGPFLWHMWMQLLTVLQVAWVRLKSVTWDRLTDDHYQYLANNSRVALDGGATIFTRSCANAIKYVLFVVLTVAAMYIGATVVNDNAFSDKAAPKKLWMACVKDAQPSDRLVETVTDQARDHGAWCSTTLVSMPLPCVCCIRLDVVIPESREQQQIGAGRPSHNDASGNRGASAVGDAVSTVVDPLDLSRLRNHAPDTDVLCWTHAMISTNYTERMATAIDLPPQHAAAGLSLRVKRRLPYRIDGYFAILGMQNTYLPLWESGPAVGRVNRAIEMLNGYPVDGVPLEDENDEPI